VAPDRINGRKEETEQRSNHHFVGPGGGRSRFKVVNWEATIKLQSCEQTGSVRSRECRGRKGSMEKDLRNIFEWAGTNIRRAPPAMIRSKAGEGDRRN